MALDIEDCGASICDGAYVEYSLDGRNWARLGANGQGTNWYNKNYASNNMWSAQNYDRWHVATIPLSVIPVPVTLLSRQDMPHIWPIFLLLPEARQDTRKIIRFMQSRLDNRRHNDLPNHRAGSGDLHTPSTTQEAVA